MHRALAVLACGAFLTLVIGVVGAAEPVQPLVLGALFTILATVGFGWVTRRSAPWSYGYLLAQLPLAFVIFTLNPGVGATLFLVVLVSQCVLLFPVPVTAAVIVLVPLVHVGMSWGDGLREGLGTLVAVVFAAVVTELLRREQRTRRELAAAHAQLRDYAVQAERLATAQERNRVARDIHDGLGHSLTVVQMQIKAARAVLAEGAPAGGATARADAVLEKAEHQSVVALADVRRSVRALRSVRPLRDALASLVAETSAAGVATAFSVTGEARDLLDEASETLYRVAQEGLTNVRKHAGAQRADVVLGYGDGVVRLEVRDDGVGADLDASAGFGLVGLRERAAHLGGRLDVETAPGEGCVLRMEVPA